MNTCKRHKLYMHLVGIGLLSLLFSLHCQAGPMLRYTSRRYTTENGLLQNSINMLMQDREGFLWIATQGGLCRFDGANFQIYNSSNNIFPVSRIKELTYTSQGRLYIQLSKPGEYIYYWDPTKGFKYDNTLNRNPPVFISGYETVMLDSQLVLTGPGGVQKTFYAKAIAEVFNKFPVNDHQFYLEDRHQLLWIDTRSRTYRTCALVPDFHTAMIVGKYLLVFDHNWNCQVWDGYRKLDSIPATTAFREFFSRLKQHPTPDTKWFQNNARPSMLFRYNNAVWLIGLEQGQLNARMITADIDPSHITMSLLYDEVRRTLYIGSLTNGLYILQENSFETLYNTGQKPWSNNIYSLIQTDSRHIMNWYYQCDPVRKTYKPLSFPLQGNGFCRTADNRIWYSQPGKICITDSSLKTRKTLSFAASAQDKLTRLFLEDEEHTLWVSTQSSLGYVRKDTLANVFLDDPYFTRNNITFLFNFDKEWLWIGNSNGIVPYHKRSRKRGKVLLPGNDIQYVFRAKDSSIWLCTYGKGIYKFHHGRFISFPPDANRNLLFAHSITEDANGFFWIPTNNGLIQCQKAELETYIRSPDQATVYYYNHKNIGRYTDEYNGGGCPATLQFGKLLILPSLHGMLAFDPLQVHPLLPNKEILLENLQADNLELSLTSSLSLPPDFKQLRVKVAAPYFGNQENNVLEYRLAEISLKWYPVIKGQIIYNRLPQGHYHLSIRKRTGFGAGNYAYRTLEFDVKPYWYQTFWFVALMILLSGLILFYFVRRRIRSLQNTQRKLEKIVEERTGQLTATVAELSISEQELSRITQIQEQALAIILHDIRSPLHYLSTSARHFNKHVGQLSPEEIRQHAASMMMSTGTIDKFTEELIQWLSHNTNNHKVNLERVYLPDLFAEIRALYEEIVALHHNVLQVTSTGVTYIHTDYKKLYLVIRNLLDNAHKHCRDGQILLDAQWRIPGQQLVITLSDTGKGMSPEVVRQLQDMPLSAPDLKKDKLGWAMVRYYVQLMNGRLSLTSEAGKGTVVEIILDNKV